MKPAYVGVSMNFVLKLFVILGITGWLPGVALAQQASPDRLAVAFSDPSRPGLLRVRIMTGRITVTGYNGKDVIVTSDALRRSRPAPPEARGLKRLNSLSSG